MEHFSVTMRHCSNVDKRRPVVGKIKGSDVNGNAQSVGHARLQTGHIVTTVVTRYSRDRLLRRPKPRGGMLPIKQKDMKICIVDSNLQIPSPRSQTHLWEIANL